MRRSSFPIALIFLLLPGLMLAPVWSRGGLGASEDDLLYYYPARALLHDFAQAGVQPWLNPWVGLVRPYLADPQTALFYPPTWLFGFIEPAVAYPLVLWLHYSLAMFGAYRLIRSLSCDRTAALFGAVAFGFCGFMLAHRAHFTIQNAAAWMPLVFWRMNRLRDGPSPARLGQAALVCGLQILSGHIQIAGLTGVGTLVWALGGRQDWRCLARMIGAWLLGGLICAAQIVPTALYLSLCTRTQRTFWDFVENPWSPLSALGLVFPMLFGQRTPNLFPQEYWGPSHQVEQFMYPGILVVLLAIVALRRPPPVMRGFLALLIVAVLIALGPLGPICPIAYWLPGASLFRVPARAMLLVNLALVVLAAWQLNQMGRPISRGLAHALNAAGPIASRPWTVAAYMLGMPLLLTAAIGFALGGETRSATIEALRPWNPAVWIPIGISIVSLLWLREMTRKWKQPRFRRLAILILTADLAIIGWTIDVPRAGSREELLPSFKRTPWAEEIADSRERFWLVCDRAWPAPPGEYVDSIGKLAANTNSLLRVQSVVDYGPLQPRDAMNFLAFKPWGEATRPRELLEDAGWMNACNVGWVLIDGDDLPAPAGAELVQTTAGGQRLFRNPLARGPAFFENAAEPGVVRFVPRTPYDFTTVVDTWPAGEARPAGEPPRVVVSQLMLPGWKATTAEGVPLALEASSGFLLSARLPSAGVHEIRWTYHPPGLFEGACGSAVGLLVAAGLMMFGQHKS